jgi:predicted acyltransferase
MNGTMDNPLAAPATKSARIVSLDVMRGIVIAFMILVNNDGSETLAYTQLKHSAWSGWTFTDLVFPSFLFMIGVTVVFSTEARLSKGTTRRELIQHTLQRAIALFCFGLIVNGFPHFPLATWRIYGVLQRLAVCYLAASTIYLFSRRAITFIAVAVTALIAYYILMRFIPVPGFGLPTRDIPLLDPNRNWVAYIDRAIFPHRLYERVRDPEGLLSTIPALGTICFGVLTALWLRTKLTPARKALGLLAGAVVGLASGELWNLWFPINKKLWTSSFVLFAAGCTLLLFTICYSVIDLKQWRGRWMSPMIIFGSNAITAYMVSELLASVLESIHIDCGGTLMNLKVCAYTSFFQHIVTPSFGSLIYSLTFVAICFIPNTLLYRNRIFLKV